MAGHRTSLAQPAHRRRPDAARVLAGAFGQPLHQGEIADVLDWTIDRVRRAAALLATRARPGGGTRLTVTGDTLTLDLAPGMLDPAGRRRLNQLLHAHGLGPDPHVLHVIHQLSDPYSRRRHTIDDLAPDLLAEALEYQLVIQQTEPTTGAAEVDLHPDVKFSLGITHYRYPPEGDAPRPRDAATTEDPMAHAYRRTVSRLLKDPGVNR